LVGLSVLKQGDVINRQSVNLPIPIFLAKALNREVAFTAFHLGVTITFMLYLDNVVNLGLATKISESCTMLIKF
jgi:hypothetical protein